MNSPITFPDSFSCKPHKYLNGTLFKYYDDNDNELISILFGKGFYSNGIDTFEVWDYENIDEPQGHMTIDQINDYLNKHYNDTT